MQKQQCRPMEIGVYVTAPETYRGLLPSPLRTSLRVWEIALADVDQRTPFHETMPLLGSPLALKASLRAGMARWNERGYECMGDLYENGILKTKRGLLGDLGGTAAVALVILQVTAFIRHRWGLGQLIPEESQLVKGLMSVAEGGRPVSQLYRILQDMAHVQPLQVKENWDRDLGMVLSEAQWRMACEHTKSVSTAMRFRLIQYKYLTQWYLTPLRLAKFVPGMDVMCGRCRGGLATFYHMVWECPVVQNFWCTVCDELDRMVGRSIDREPVVVLLGCMKKMEPLLRKFLGLAFLLAKRTIAMVWMRQEPPRVDTWMRAMVYCQAIESRIPEVMGSRNMPKYCWEWFDDYVRSGDEVEEDE